MTAQSTPANTGDSITIPANIRWVLLGVMLALLLSMLDGLIVGTAMPTVVADLGGLDHMSWVVTGYTLATACSTPVWGKVGDQFHRKTVFLTSVALFIVASVLCGTAGSMAQLIVFRIIQGLGAGGMGAGAFSLIGALLPPRERGKYQGMTAAVMAIGQLGGPLVGGFVTSHLGWHWAFYINVPLGVACIIWCWLLLHLPPAQRPEKIIIDWLGITFLTGAITALVLAATWAGSTYAWLSWQIIGLAVLALTLLAAFVATERRATEPLMPPRIYSGHRNFPIAAILLTVSGVTVFGATLYLPLYQQVVQAASAANSGLLLLPMMIATLITSSIAGKVMTATGRYKIFPVLGCLLAVVGLGLLSTMSTDTPRALTSLYMVILGAGTGLSMQMASTIAQNAVELRDIGSASAATNLFRNLGGSIGIALFASLLTGNLTVGITPAPGERTDPRVGSAHLTQAARDLYVHDVAHATHLIFLTGAGIAVAALIASVLIKEVPLRGTPDTATSARPDAETG
ncbi:MDR family MFS transporter [Amycolatopsis sp. CA-126428]|uniref:MDR family MFS transporter n=1 Tax=Amycolatopsis sp. CA-126428 TaxID=2073158 RepID=UPI000CD209A0|nr:MDR family MFS transporter [Amycolatopsis sp. CA-126428]